VAAVLRIKERVPDKTLPLIAADVAQVEWLAGRLSPRARQLASRWWPGPLTLVLEVRQSLAPGVVAADGSVAVRVPAHDLACDLARLAGGPLTSTSANRAGQPPAVTAEDCWTLGDDVAVVLDGGPARATIPSTIVDVRGADLRLLREGAVPWDHVLHSTR
jgi:tRNA threonylcarbamoyl adenosine modification protein (Sua5/YciO/YrdC/YwlC family)